MVINHFNDDERIILNGICRNKIISSLTKRKVEDELLVAISMIDENEQMAIDLYEGAREKLKSMTDEEWDELKLCLPFETSFPDDEEESEEI